MSSPNATAVLLLACRDRPGIVAATGEFVATAGGNIIDAQQHMDRASGMFFQRIEFELEGFAFERHEIPIALKPLVERFAMEYSLQFSDRRKRVGILVSKQPHCLYDLLTRWKFGELQAEIVVVISNHPDHSEAAKWFGIEYLHLPVTPATKRDQEAQLIAALHERDVELVVMARYMQVLSDDVVDLWPDRIINIHHSFLPAFVGAKPYHQAHDRGVKLIGVTAHYATAELDEGPIIEQDVVRVSHRDDIDDLVRIGRDLEVAVLARAVSAHLQHRVLVHGRRTVVF